MPFPYSLYAASGPIRRAASVCAGSIAVLTVSLLYSHAALAADAPLTLAEAQRLAVAQSRQIPARQFAATAAGEMAVAAGQLPDPVLKMGITNLPVDGPMRWRVNDDFMTMRSMAICAHPLEKVKVPGTL